MNKLDKNNFCIIVSSFNYGGIEILVKRLASILANNYSVHVFLLTNKYDKNLVNELIKQSYVHFPKNFLKYNFFPDVAGCNAVLPIKNRYKSILNNSFFVHVTDSHCLTFLMSNLCPNKLSPGLSVGNYQSEEYIWKSNWYFRKVELNLFKNLNPQSVYSMNSISIDKLSKIHGEKFISSKMMPAGIDIPTLENNSDLSRRKNFLVCVGRLVKFKSYIEHVIRDVPKILKYCPDFEFHIYGDGPEKDYLQKLSKGLPVIFKGSVDISILNETISSYRVFIGSGTSILTASSLKVPSVIGIESINKSETYGFLYETSGLDYQEIGLKYPKHKIYKKVIEALIASDDTYDDMCLRSRERSKIFCITNTVNMLEKTVNVYNKPSELRFFKKVGYLISVFLWAITNRLGISDSKLNRHYIDSTSDC